MRYLALFAALCSACVSFVTAAVKVGVDKKGVAIDAGLVGRFVLAAPVLVGADKTDQKPVIEVESPTRAKATYPGGAVIEIETSAAGEATFTLSGIPADARQLRFTTLLPINLNQGGRFTLGGGQAVEFPVVREKQLIAAGDATRLEIRHALGEGFAIQTPGAYQQIQDNRTWNWNVFAWNYFYDLRRHAGKNTIRFVVEPVKADATAAAGPAFLVDRFGQSARKDYPGKIKDEEALRAAGVPAELAVPHPKAPALDAFGGYAGSGAELGLKGTGFFRVERLASGRDVLVTPEGNAFFQLGVCGIANTDDFTTVRGRERVYEWLPAANDPLYRAAWRDSRPDWGVFSFQIANWIRKHGRPYSYEDWSGEVVDNLRAWGFNSAGAFANYSNTMRERGFPYVLTLPNGKAEGVKMLPDRVGAAELMDPFAPGAEEALDKAFAAALPRRAADPLLIGYFLGNEQHFESLPKLIPAYPASKAAAKRRLVESLREKYADVAAFNAAWKLATPFASFDDLLEAPLFVRTETAATDVREFCRLYVETYYAMVRRVFKKYDANHLLIGSRWTPHTANNEDVVRIGGRYLDVVSVNYYTYAIEADFLRKVHAWSGRPIILSEWYYSSTEAGLGGGKEVRDQRERGLAYRNYIEQSAALPFVVGSQWFIYSDQSITGRFFEGLNGEGNNTGLVDVTGRPYVELVSAARETHARLPGVLFKGEKPFAHEDARFSGGTGGAAKVVAIPRALPGMKFDGTTTNWPGRPAEPVDPNRLAVGNPNPALRGDFRLCWDERALHLLVQVKDPTPGRNDHEPKRYWSGDGVELFLGARNLAEPGNMLFSDRQVLISAGEKPGVFVVDHPEAGAACRVLVLKDVTGDGYTLQAELPWTALGIEPRAELEMLFDLAIDNSDDGVARLQQLVWNGTAKNSGDRSAWGRARLVEN